jgi:hypothetical protein
MRKSALIVAVSALCAMAGVSPARAQFGLRPIDKETRFTFSEPVALPTVTLPAGTYVFRLADPNYAPDVVMVMNAAGTIPYAMVHTTPVERVETKGNHSQMITFREGPAGQAQKIDSWFYDSMDTPIGFEDTGCELTYPPLDAR